jgi:signal transduction histidine kinase
MSSDIYSMIPRTRPIRRAHLLPDESIAAEVLPPLLIITGSMSAVSFGLLLLAQYQSGPWPYLLALVLGLSAWFADWLQARDRLQAAGTVLAYTYALVPVLTIIPFGVTGNIVIYLAGLGVIVASILVSPSAPLQVARNALLLLLALIVLPSFFPILGLEQPSLAIGLAAFVSMSVLLVGIAAFGWVGAHGIRGTIGWAIEAGAKAERREKLLRATQSELELAIRERDGLNDRLYKVNQDLETARADAETAYRSKASFMATMSHELRTPLNIIIGFSSAMLDHPEMYGDQALPEMIATDVAEIRRSGQHLLQLINDILDLAKVEAGALELNRVSIPLLPLLDEMMQTARGLAGDRPVSLRREYHSPLPNVQADEIRVRQVLLNLVSNAVKFTSLGEIAVGARADDFEVVIWVRDTGIGIADEDQERIFARFEQAGNADTREHGGTGLGLSICKWLVELHNGRMWLESELGKGSIFYFTLPRAQPAIPGTPRSPQSELVAT